MRHGHRPAIVATTVPYRSRRGRHRRRDSDRVLTVPNLLSVLRLAGVPLFLWLLLAGGGTPATDVWAILVLAARRDHRLGSTASSPACSDQYSRLGALLDPAVDRLYILAALLGARPARRRAVVGGRRAGRPRPGARACACPCCAAAATARPPVIYLGKAATFLLL